VTTWPEVASGSDDVEGTPRSGQSTNYSSGDPNDSNVAVVIVVCVCVMSLAALTTTLVVILVRSNFIVIYASLEMLLLGCPATAYTGWSKKADAQFYFLG